MKTIGLIGGMSWESTAEYYRLINEGVKQRLGGLHSAKIVLISVDFAEIEALQMAGDWQKAGQILAQAAVSLQSAGADFFLICTNTMHTVADQVQSSVRIPMLHIADATAEILVVDGISRVGLLGTSFTMEQDFYTSTLCEGRDITVITPPKSSRGVVHQVIYNELCLGKIVNESRDQYIQIVEDLKQQGAHAVILGCTEISLLINQSHTDLTLYDTTLIHAQKAVEYSLA